MIGTSGKTLRSLAVLAAAALSLVEGPALAAGAATIHADLIDTAGKRIGMVEVRQTPAGVLVRAGANGLPPGEHGFHFHEKGICDPAKAFATAGGHFVGAGHQHGLMVMGGPHGGDMPNQHVGADGVLASEVLDTGAALDPGGASLLDADGTALVIHAKADDYTSQPAGNAGDRIACAVIAGPK